MSFGDTLFGGGKPGQIYYSPQTNRNLSWLGKQFQGDNSTYTNALDAFTQANANTTAQLAKNAAQANQDYNNLYQANANYNPLDTYNSIRNSNLAALQNYSGDLESAGARNDKLALAAMGMGGQPDSSYASLLRADRVSKNMAPVLGNIMSSLGNDTATIGNQRSQNLGNLTNLINLRTNTPLIGYGMQLDPANALNAIRGNQLGQLGAAAGVAKENNAGFYTDPGIMDYWDRWMQSIGRTAAAAQSVEGAIGGAGGMGGMGGMGGSGGSSGGTNMPALGNFTQQQSSMPTSSGGGGGMDMSTIMNLIKMFQGGSNQAPSAGGYNPWANYGGGANANYMGSPYLQGLVAYPNDYFDTPAYNTSSPYA